MGKGGGKAGKHYDGGKAPRQYDGGKSGKGQESARRSNQSISKNRPLEMIRSLSSNDDERMAMSKKISWILRHGAKRIGINSEEEGGWVKMSDLLQAEILENVPEEKVLSVIEQSNAQKLRYELKDTAGVKFIKAISKDKRKELAALSPGAGQQNGGIVKPSAEAQPVDASQPTEESQGGMRISAPAFVPSPVNLQSMLPPPASFPPVAGYPWQLAAASFGYPLMPPNFGPMTYPWQLAAAAMSRPPAPPPSAPTGPTGAAGPTGITSARYHGRIKSFNAEKGFGFIESTEAHMQYGRDVFLHKALIGDLKVNDEVIFGVQFNEKGMPQAKDLATPQGQFISVAPLEKGSGKGGKGKAGRGKAGRNEEKGGKGTDPNRAARGEKAGQGKRGPGSPVVTAANSPPVVAEADSAPVVDAANPASDGT